MTKRSSSEKPIDAQASHEKRPPATILPNQKENHIRTRKIQKKLREPEIDKNELILRNILVTFGENLRYYRLKAGFRQMEVAESTGLTQQYLSLIEMGQQNITIKTMVMLSSVVGKDITTMLVRLENYNE